MTTMAAPSRVLLFFLPPILLMMFLLTPTINAQPSFLGYFCLFLLTPTINAQPSFLGYFCLSEQGNYTTKSNYQTNLYTLLSSLTSDHNIDTGFYSSFHGETPDKVYATGLCRGYVKPEACRSCLDDASKVLTRLCPNEKEAIGWYEKCTLRYSNLNLSGIMETNPPLDVTNERNVSSDVDVFNQQLVALFENLRDRAVIGGSSHKYAVGNTTIPYHFGPVYGLVQCTPDLSGQDCNDCIDAAIANLERCCYGRLGVYVALPSCMINYDLNRFYDLEANTPAPPPPEVLPPSHSTNSTDVGKKNNTSRSVAFTVVPSVVAFLALLIFIFLCLRNRKAKGKIESFPLYEATEDQFVTVESLQYDFTTISAATDNFSEENKLGRGGFGVVYKGRLSNGQDIAVKRLSKQSGQGDLEFKNEVLLVAKLQHRNLVRLLGFCLRGDERLLVYEFLPNASLDYFLFDPTKRANLDWDKHYKIIGSIARGLLYLHEDSRLRIIHRDLKASNILLDEKMQPKISDFGMARLFVEDQTQDRTNRIVGTYGYMAPEYAMCGRFSFKSDIFSFGVLLLEMVSGQRNNNCFHHGEEVEYLLTYAWRSWRDGSASNLIDPSLRLRSGPEIMRCIHIGLLCVQENVADRPTMNAVLRMLNSYSLSLPVPSEPAFYMHSEGTAVNISASHDDLTPEVQTESSNSRGDSVHASMNEASISELYPR